MNTFGEKSIIIKNVLIKTFNLNYIIQNVTLSKTSNNIWNKRKLHNL